MTELKDILYVEDEPNIREVAEMALVEVGGFKVVSCDSGLKALEALETYTPQLIMMDVMMPQMDGITLFHSVRTLPNGKDIPVIFMTAKVQTHEMEKYKAMGSLGIISKPFSAMLLAKQVKELWDSQHG